MKFEIKHRFLGNVLFSCEAESWRVAWDLSKFGITIEEA